MFKDWELRGLRFYHMYRRRVSPVAAADLVHNDLLMRAQALCNDGLHDQETAYRRHAEHWQALADLAESRRDNDTKRGRYWLTGNLSDRDDVMVWISEGSGWVSCQSRCKSLGCALKHGRALFLSGRVTQIALYDRDDHQLTDWANSAAELELMVRELVG